MKNTGPLKYITLAAVLFVIAVTVWYHTPVELLKVDPDSVSKVTIFDGNQGKQVELTDPVQVRRIVENLNSVTLRRGKISTGYTGYRFHLEVYTYSGESERLAARFIVNTADSIRKDPFFYRVENGEIDFDFIQSLFS